MRSAPLSSRSLAWRWALIAGAGGATALVFSFFAGWLSPSRLTPARFANQFQTDGGHHYGFRRNHAKGVCFTGYFQSSGEAQAYSVAGLFAPGVKTPVVGRFAVPGPNPTVADASVPVRSMALRFQLGNGQQWRTGMNNSPVFAVATPQAFYQRLVAHEPLPSTGKADKKKIAAFRAAHPGSKPFFDWAKATPPSSSFATQTYRSLNAFYFVAGGGRSRPVRWRMVPEAMPTRESDTPKPTDYLAGELAERLKSGALTWHLIVTLGTGDDPTRDATKAWPANRPSIDAGTLTVTATAPESNGECRDINYDPTVLPAGIRVSNDPLLAARSAAYSESYRRRTAEEADLPGTVKPAAPEREQ